ncbi:MAG: ATP-binding protein, partial [Thermoplasmatales archaeon]
MKFDKPANAKILEALTSGLYDGNSNCIREYVQNAIDSGADTIKIYYQNNLSENDVVDIVIRDNGTGMSKEELYNALLLGSSSKSGQMGGWRGIGIYSGVPNFRKIFINTRKEGDLKYSVSIDCDGIRANYRREMPLEEILEIGVPGEIESEDDETFSTGTQLILSSVLPNQTEYFKKETLKNYLVRTLPLPFKKSSMTKKIISELEKFGISQPKYLVKFEGEDLYRPPLDDSLFDERTLSFSSFKVDDRIIAIAWSVTSKSNKELTGVHRGIVFKKKGYTIGNAELVRNRYNGAYNYWQCGEIHILDDEILENSARNNFEINSGKTKELFEWAGEYVKESQQNNRKKSRYDQEKKIERVKSLIKMGKPNEAKRSLKAIEAALTSNVSGAESGELKKVADVYDDDRKRSLRYLSEAKQEIKSYEGSTEEKQVQALLDSLPFEQRKQMQDFIKAPKFKTFIHVMMNIEDKIKERTGSKDPEFKDLMMDTFGSTFSDDPRQVSGKAKILLFDPSKLNKSKAARKPSRTTEDYPYYVTAGFGSLLYEMYNIFINGAKHYGDA